MIIRVPLYEPENHEHVNERMVLVRKFMVWKQAVRFVMMAELMVPDVIHVVGVGRETVVGALQEIRREPVGFVEVEWLDRAHVDPWVVGMLPEDGERLSVEDLMVVGQLFGIGGKFEAQLWEI